MQKDVFINGYKQSNKKLKLYIIKFEKNDVLKSKIYLVDCVIEKNNW